MIDVMILRRIVFNGVMRCGIIRLIGTCCGFAVFTVVRSAHTLFVKLLRIQPQDSLCEMKKK